MTLTEKLTRLQCALSGTGLGSVYYSALWSYGRFLYHFSPATSEHTPPPSPSIPLAAPAGHREGVVIERSLLVGPHVPSWVILQQIAPDGDPNVPDETSVDSGITEDAQPGPSAIAVAHPEMVRILSSPPLKPAKRTTPKKNPFVKLIWL